MCNKSIHQQISQNILDPPTIVVGEGPQMSEWLKSKDVWEIESLLLKDNTGCLSKSFFYLTQITTRN